MVIKQENKNDNFIWVFFFIYNFFITELRGEWGRRRDRVKDRVMVRIIKILEM